MTLRLALLSYWHVHAKDYEREAGKNPDTTVTVVWDENPARGAENAARIGARFESEFAAVLADPEIDGVIVTTATAEHHRVMTAAANAGKHIFTEKVIAATTTEADDVLAAVDAAGVIMTVCLPRISNGYTQAIKAILNSGELGTIHYSRVRVGHDGALPTEANPDGWLPPQFFSPEEAQGGALLDFGAHPLYLSQYFLGTPAKVTSRYGYVTGHALDDHAVVTLSYGNGAIAVAEVSFLDNPGVFEIEIHGTNGSLRYAIPDGVLRRRRGSATRERNDWEIVEDVPSDLPSPFDQWVERVKTGQKAPENLALARALTVLAEASERSAKEERTISID
jgi:predicted dehydrogenase